MDFIQDDSSESVPRVGSAGLATAIKSWQKGSQIIQAPLTFPLW